MDSILNLLGEMGWREALLLLIVGLTIYFIIMVLRLLQLPRISFVRGLDMPAPAVRSVPPEFDAPPGSVLAGVWPGPAEPSLLSPSEPGLLERAMERVRSEEAPAPDFASQLNQKSLEHEVWQLREQLSDAREEIGRLREEMKQVQAAQSVSPLYHEATSMALRGVDAAGVAGRCGISIAEAELVVALSRKPMPPAPAEDIQDEESHDRDTHLRASR